LTTGGFAMSRLGVLVVVFCVAVRVYADAPLPAPRSLEGSRAEVNYVLQDHGAAPSANPPASFTEQLERLKAARERLAADRQQALFEPDEAENSEAELAPLRRRLHELLLRRRLHQLPARPDTGPLPDIHTPPPKPRSIALQTVAEKSGGPTPAPVDALSLANALFQVGEFEAALKAYRQVNVTRMRAEEKAPTLYLTACCLRNLGKLDEATQLFREVAAMKDDLYLAECAQWQVSNLRMRKELETKLLDLRRRRQALENSP